MQNDVFEKARRFMYRNARPLDLARFRYHFENGSREDVMQVLACYQNEDGGLGYAVEADCWNPHSTQLHTSTAAEIIRQIDWQDGEHPVIQGMLEWCESGRDFNGKTWNLLPNSNNDYPHAPWWHTESRSTCHADYNGTAQLAGFIVRYAKQDSDVCRLGVRIANEAIEALDENTINDQHVTACYIRMANLFEKAGMKDKIPFDCLKKKLKTAVNKLIDRDESHWNGYVCMPSVFIDSPSSEYYPGNEEAVKKECAFRMERQLEDGSWNIPWSWEKFPEEWAISKNWWRGQVILENLMFLKAFGKI